MIPIAFLFALAFLESRATRWGLSNGPRAPTTRHAQRPVAGRKVSQSASADSCRDVFYKPRARARSNTDMFFLNKNNDFCHHLRRKDVTGTMFFFLLVLPRLPEGSSLVCWLMLFVKKKPTTRYDHCVTQKERKEKGGHGYLLHFVHKLCTHVSHKHTQTRTA